MQVPRVQKITLNMGVGEAVGDKKAISKAQNDLEKIKERIDVIFVTVGTPTTLGSIVDYSQVYTALEEVCKVDLRNKIVVMRSTLPPRTTTDIIIPFIENKTGLITGSDFHIAVCPERILEGQAVKEIQEFSTAAIKLVDEIKIPE